MKILIYPTLNYIDISSYFPIKRNESHLMEPPFSFSCVYEGLTQPRIRWILISRRNIPLRHLCETWQTGSFPRLHSFDELFKSQSPDSLLHCNGQNLSLKMGNTYSQTVFALFYRFTMAPSKGFRMPPFNHVHVLSETVN